MPDEGGISFLLYIISNSIDDIREEHIVIIIYNIYEVVFICIFERDEVGSHEALDEILVFLVRVLFLLIYLLFESRIWVDIEV